MWLFSHWVIICFYQFVNILAVSNKTTMIFQFFPPILILRQSLYVDQNLPELTEAPLLCFPSVPSVTMIFFIAAMRLES